MYDIANDRHIDDKVILFSEGEHAAILKQVDFEDEDQYGQDLAVEISTRSNEFAVVVESRDGAMWLVKALEKAIDEDWWS